MNILPGVIAFLANLLRFFITSFVNFDVVSFIEVLETNFDVLGTITFFILADTDFILSDADFTSLEANSTSFVTVFTLSEVIFTLFEIDSTPFVTVFTLFDVKSISLLLEEDSSNFFCVSLNNFQISSLTLGSIILPLYKKESTKVYITIW